MRAILPAHPAHVDEPQVRLVDESRRLQRVTRALPFQTTPRNLVQLAVHERNELLEGGLVALSPGDQQCRNVVHRPPTGGDYSARPAFTLSRPVSRLSQRDRAHVWAIRLRFGTESGK